MSGFEVAGAVLGSLPLIISALEHYSDGVRLKIWRTIRAQLMWLQVSAIKNMQKYEAVFEYLHASFVTSLAIYRNSCEELLSPLALPDSKLYDLLEKTDGGSWEDPELNTSLRNRLGSN